MAGERRKDGGDERVGLTAHLGGRLWEQRVGLATAGIAKHWCEIAQPLSLILFLSPVAPAKETFGFTS